MALQSTTGHHVASILLLISQVSSGMCRRRYVSVIGWPGRGGRGRYIFSIEKQT